MICDANTVAIPLSGFWSPTPRENQPRLDTPTALAERATAETTWDELVSWFEQQREWAQLAATFEPAAG